MLLPQEKVTDEVACDLQLAPLEHSISLEGSGLKLVDRLLAMNCTSPELEELRVKAQNETEDIWQLRDGLLLRYGKLYVPDGLLTPETPLRTALIREAHDQPLIGHPGRAKLRQLLQSRYYWPGQGRDID